MEEKVILNRRPNEKFCKECGSKISIRAEICPKCGVRQRPNIGNKKIIAGILAIIFGVFGAHKFFLGKPGQGLVYLLFFWTGIPSLVGLIEGIIYLVMDDYAFYEKYGS